MPFLRTEAAMEIIHCQFYNRHLLVSHFLIWISQVEGPYNIEPKIILYIYALQHVHDCWVGTSL